MLVKGFVWGFYKYILRDRNAVKFSIKLPYLTSMVFYLLSQCVVVLHCSPTPNVRKSILKTVIVIFEKIICDW